MKSSRLVRRRGAAGGTAGPGLAWGMRWAKGWVWAICGCLAAAGGGRAEEPAGHRLRSGDLELWVEVAPAAYEARFGPRFDRTAAVRAVRVAGREWLGEWGLVDEFGIEGGDATPGFGDAVPGGDFVKVGFGRLAAPADARGDASPGYDFTRRYEVRERFPVEVLRRDARRLEVRQRVPGLYDYTKSYEAAPGRRLRIRYGMTNLSGRPWTADHYNHHWFVLAPPPPGPDWRLRLGGLASAPEARKETDGWTAIPSRDLLVPARSVGRRQTLFWTTRHSAPPAENRFRLEHPGGDRAVSFRGDYPRHRVAVYVDDHSFCPEIFFARRLAPGESVEWSATYRFFDDDRGRGARSLPNGHRKR